MEIVKRFLSVLAIAGVAASCETKEVESTTYFERSISPILTTSCTKTNTGAGCHVADAKGNALGNLDVVTYENLVKRRDLLVDYGPYGQPAFLIKNVEPFQVEVQSYDGAKSIVTTDIKHAGGSILDPTGSGYQTLRRWIQAGATENNTGVPPAAIDRLPCSSFIPTRAGFDLTKDPPGNDFGTFKNKANAVLTGTVGGRSCAAGNCHGTIANTLYLTCGNTAEEIRWNYLASEEYLAQTPEQAELLRRPLSPSQGGAFHEGGVIFQSPSDEGYQSLDAWAREHGPLKVESADPGFLFFAHKVQPALVKKGCMMIQCHSGSMFHDYRLRGGSGGSFSLSATRKNYELSLQQMAVETDDINASRMVRKNLYRPEVCSVNGCGKPSGIAHRGGPLLEDFRGDAASSALCDAGNHDYENGDVDKIPAYCILREWLRRERDIFKLAPMSAIVYVKRPVGSTTKAKDFDVYQPGADLRRVSATLASGAVTVDAASDTSLTARCGLSTATADIRRPQVSWDGTKIAFAARASASEPLAIYEMNADGSECAKHAAISSHAANQNGLLVHDFDPTYAPPPGGLVFASTRGNLNDAAYGYSGPQRTPADPSKPNANLYVSDGGGIRQLTFQLNMEREPSFMTDGRLVFAAEKRAPGFYQLALRRLNLDTGDYHPLYAQRGTIGHSEATQPIEIGSKDFAAIFSNPDSPNGGGTIAFFNRSLGIDFRSTNGAEYVVDPGVLDPNNLNAPDPNFFLRSLRLPDPGGDYISPAPLPDAQILVSFATGGGDYDVYVMDSGTGQKTKLFGDANGAEVDAVAVYAKLVRPIFRSTLDEPNGHTRIDSSKAEAEIHVLDLPVLASLLFQNTPTGRLVDPDITSVDVYEDMPPPPEVASFDQGGANVASDSFGRVYVRRRLLGTAPVRKDGSTKITVPGGVPIVLKLPDTPTSQEKKLPRWQRESMTFSPGEYVHQSFKRGFFDGLCAQCHGSISGKPLDAALNVDFVTQASQTESRGEQSFNFTRPPNERPAPEGPPASP